MSSIIAGMGKVVPLGNRIFAVPNINPENSALVYLAREGDQVLPKAIKDAIPLLRKVAQVLNRKEKERVRATWARVMGE